MGRCVPSFVKRTRRATRSSAGTYSAAGPWSRAGGAGNRRSGMAGANVLQHSIMTHTLPANLRADTVCGGVAVVGPLV